MIKCESLNAEASPFRLRVHSNVLVLMDLHAHLSSAEIIGFLGGTWDSQNKGTGESDESHRDKKETRVPSKREGKREGNKWARDEKERERKTERERIKEKKKKRGRERKRMKRKQVGERGRERKRKQEEERGRKRKRRKRAFSHVSALSD